MTNYEIRKKYHVLCNVCSCKILVENEFDFETIQERTRKDEREKLEVRIAELEYELAENKTHTDGLLKMEREKVLKIITPLLEQIANSRKCSIGDIHNTYECQISVKRINAIKAELELLENETN